MPYEDLNAYQAHCAKALAGLQPVGYMEEQLAQTIADAHWRLNRARAIENNIITLGFHDHSPTLSIEHPEARAAMATAKAGRNFDKNALGPLNDHW